MNRGAIVLLRTAGDDADDLAAQIRNLGYEVLIEPMLSIEYLEADYTSVTPQSPLVFTSSHAVRATARNTAARSNPVYTVGANTAQTARNEGFDKVVSADGDAGNLADLLQDNLRNSLISPIYVRAEEITQDLKGLWPHDCPKLVEIIGYRAVKAQNLSLKVLNSLDHRKIKAVAVFSARGGKVFADLIEQYGRGVRLKTVKALCLSEAVLKSVSVLPFEHYLTAAKPDRYGMMELVEQISVNEEKL